MVINIQKNYKDDLIEGEYEDKDNWWKKIQILAEFVKDISSETKDVESYIYTKENISKYKLFIDINTKPLKNKMAEVSISTKFKEDSNNQMLVISKWYMQLL